MSAFLNLKGQIFDRLTALTRVANNNSGRVCWLCKCACGNKTIATTHELRAGCTKSCGCLKKETAVATVLKASESNIIHGHSRRGHHSPTYRSWQAMIQRCTNPNTKGYARYGGIGVRVAPEWMTLKGLISSIGERPANTSLGRILDMGNYERGNAFWMTDDEQKLAQMNKRALRAFGRLGFEFPYESANRIAA